MYVENRDVNFYYATFKSIFLNLFTVVSTEDISKAFSSISSTDILDFSVVPTVVEGISNALPSPFEAESGWFSRTVGQAAGVIGNFLAQTATMVVSSKTTANVYEIVNGPEIEKMHIELIAKVKKANLDTEYGFEVFGIVLIGLFLLLFFFICQQIFNGWRSRDAVNQIKQAAKDAVHAHRAIKEMPQSGGRITELFSMPRGRHRRRGSV